MMNIRSISNPTPTEAVKPTDKKTSQSSKDRDPQSGGESSQDQRRKYSDEELEEIVAHLSEHSGIQQNNLTVSFDNSGSASIVFIKDHLGAVVRRIVGEELSSIFKDETDRPGHLINKAV